MLQQPEAAGQRIPHMRRKPLAEVRKKLNAQGLRDRSRRGDGSIQKSDPASGCLPEMHQGCNGLVPHLKQQGTIPALAFGLSGGNRCKLQHQRRKVRGAQLSSPERALESPYRNLCKRSEPRGGATRGVEVRCRRAQGGHAERMAAAFVTDGWPEPAATHGTERAGAPGRTARPGQQQHTCAPPKGGCPRKFSVLAEQPERCSRHGREE